MMLEHLTMKASNLNLSLIGCEIDYVNSLKNYHCHTIYDLAYIITGYLTMHTQLSVNIAGSQSQSSICHVDILSLGFLANSRLVLSPFQARSDGNWFIC